MISTDFEFLAGFLKTNSGLTLTPDKAYLIESRLQPIAAKHGKGDVAGLINALRTFPTQDLRRDVIEAMTTNETSFFRDTKPFDIFKSEVLGKLVTARAARKSLRIWCAAASSGQEPYSIAILLKDDPRLAGWKIDLVATDIDTSILAKATTGRYSKFEVQRGMPIQLLMKHFTKLNDDTWEVKPEIRSMVSFRQLNLLEDFSTIGTVDVVFCRNVLIYFDAATKGGVLGKISRRLSDDGYLFLGGAETVLGVSDAFEPSTGNRGLYVKPQRLAQAA
ncbi:MAG: protein-glutamate O-methyltransferase CheR [Rhodospirillaceae bacterium]|nr:protein-glutamate O-methyltransferase CheR [Rhodospirillaceae bacterium]